MKLHTHQKSILVTVCALVGIWSFARLNGEDSKTSDPDEKLDAEVSAEVERSENEITVRQLNQFHLAVLGRILDAPELRKVSLNVQNGGIFYHRGAGWLPIQGSDESPLKLKVAIGSGPYIPGNIGHPLEWTLFHSESSYLFSFWISRRRTSLTVCECKIPSGLLYVNLDRFHETQAAADQPLPEAAGRSPRQILSLLGGGLSEREIPFPVTDIHL